MRISNKRNKKKTRNQKSELNLNESIKRIYFPALTSAMVFKHPMTGKRAKKQTAQTSGISSDGGRDPFCTMQHCCTDDEQHVVGFLQPYWQHGSESWQQNPSGSLILQ